MKKPYNGHESWAAWNVALWIDNDEGLYRLALEALEEARRQSKPVAWAAAWWCATMNDAGFKATPDGARYSLRSVRLALRGLSE